MVAQIIPAKIKPNKNRNEPQKLRVAAYARVSTDSEEQESSYEVQCTHYKNLITDNPAYRTRA